MKKKKKTGVYAGSFDLLTNGHLWMIKQGSAMFDTLIVAVGTNPDKQCMFSLEERLDMLRCSTKRFPNVVVDGFPNRYLVHYAHAHHAQFILRGVRTTSDYEVERGIRFVNGDKRPGIVTIFLTPPRKLIEVSSSMVKGLLGPRGWKKFIKGYVPGPVLKKLKEVRDGGKR